MVPTTYIRYVYLVTIAACILKLYACSEMFHAERWHSDFPTPMIIHENENIFVGDFVLISYDNSRFMAKILKYFQKVY